MEQGLKEKVGWGGTLPSSLVKVHRENLVLEEDLLEPTPAMDHSLFHLGDLCLLYLRMVPNFILPSHSAYALDSVQLRWENNLLRSEVRR